MAGAQTSSLDADITGGDATTNSDSEVVLDQTVIDSAIDAEVDAYVQLEPDIGPVLIQDEECTVADDCGQFERCAGNRCQIDMRPDVFRVNDMEEALSKNWSPEAVAGIKVPATGLNSDLHGHHAVNVARRLVDEQPEGLLKCTDRFRLYPHRTLRKIIEASEAQIDGVRRAHSAALGRDDGHKPR